MLTRWLLTSATAVAVALGWYQLFNFSTTPGAQLAAPAHWPREIPSPSVNSHAPLLLVFVHPRCSCTPATLQQLDQILSSTHTTVQVVLVVYRSKAISQETSSATSEPAKYLHVPAQIVPDTNGLLARRFGAATSGEIVLYAAGGNLLFQGGLTPMRAQPGDSAGASALRNALATGATQAKVATVFGCPIFFPGRAG
jgi:hypothetical protein